MDSVTVGVLAVVFCATMVRAVFGFGEALVAMPLLSLLVGVTVATPLVALLSTASAVVLLAHEWRQLDFRSAWRLTLSTLCGIPLGVLFLKGLPESVVRGVLAITVLGFSSYSLWRPNLVRLVSDRWAPAFGLCAGVLGGAYNTSGPPLVIYGTMRQWPPAQFRSTLQSIFLPTGLAVIATHGAAGLWTRPVIVYWVLAMPGAVLAVIVGIRIGRRISPRAFVRIIHLLMFALGLLLLLK